MVSGSHTTQLSFNDELQKKRRLSGRHKFLLWYIGVLVTVCSLLYRPLPDGFTVHSFDRVAMHFIEPALRVTYYWPSRAFFSQASGIVWWTRTVLNNLSKLVGPFAFETTLHTETKLWNNVTVRVYTPLGQRTTDGAVVFIHGGGFALGNIDMYDSLTRRLAKTLNTLVVSVEYSLSPEAVFPAGLNDCERVLDYLVEHASLLGVDPSKIVVMGDSAGGNLATVVSQRRRQRVDVPQLKAQVLIYPLLQFSELQSVSYRYFYGNLQGYALVDPESVALYYMFYAGIDMDVAENMELLPYVLSNGHMDEQHLERVKEIYEHAADLETKWLYSDSNVTVPPRVDVRPSEKARRLLANALSNPEISPLMAKDLSGMPRSLVVTCEFDVLRDEGVVYARRLDAAGVPTDHRHYAHGFHAMLNFHGEIHEASRAVDEIVEWTLSVLSL